MSDLGADYADKKTKELSKAIDRVYSQAQKDVEKKTNDFFDKFAAKEKEMLAKVNAGTMTQDAFDKWKAGQVFTGSLWKEKEKQISDTLANANKISLDLINGQKTGVFAFNANYAAYEMEHGAGINFGFSLYNTEAVTKLLKDDPSLLPAKKLDKAKDERWNQQNITSQITQGIIQGESIPDIAKRMQNVTGRNAKQSTLYARTAMTSAQNAGRMERYSEAEALGIKVKKVWLATLDDRTRVMHADLDGQEVDPDEPFEIDGYTIMYPGDPNAEPEMVYNCRCTLTTKIVDYPKSFDRRVAENGEVISDMTYREWEASKQVVDVVPEPVPEPDAIKLPTDLFKSMQSQALEDFLIGVEGKDPDVAELYGTIGEKAKEKNYPIKVSYTEKNHQVTKSTYIRSGDVAEVKVNIPKMDGDLLSQSGTTVHEVGHFVDLLYGGKNDLSSSSSELQDAIKNGNPMSEKVKNLFADLKAKGDKAYNDVMAVARQMNQDFNAQITQAYSNRNYSEALKLSKDRDKEWKKYTNAAVDAMRAEHKGYDALEDIYDAISGGALQGQGYFGHGSSYYASGENKTSETFANYCALSQTNPEGFALLKEEQPDIYNACHDLVEKMLGR